MFLQTLDLHLCDVLTCFISYGMQSDDIPLSTHFLQIQARLGSCELDLRMNRCFKGHCIQRTHRGHLRIPEHSNLLHQLFVYSQRVQILRDKLDKEHQIGYEVAHVKGQSFKYKPPKMR